MKYNPALDGIRAVAVLLVIGYHVSVPSFGTGYLGVDVFFVLSGYLITSILLREEADGGIRLGAFYLRRARRLYPALCVLVFGLLAIGWAGWTGSLRVLLYLSDYTSIPGAMSHTWSLAVEEHYYMLWPLLLPLVFRMHRSNALLLLFAVYVASSLWFELSPHVFPDASLRRFDTRMSGLVLGSLLAFLPNNTKLPLTLLGASVVLLAVGLPADRMFAEAATAAFILLSNVMVLPWVTRSWLVYIGRISYGLYLFHMPVATHFRDGIMSWQERSAIVLLVSFGLAVLSFHTIEAAFRKPASATRQRHRGWREVGPIARAGSDANPAQL